MTSVLLTGGTGFIGRHVLSDLVAKEITTHAIYTHDKPDIQVKNVKWHQVDLHDKAAVEILLRIIKPTHLLHLAWYAKPGEYWTSLHNLTWLDSSIQLLKCFIEVGGVRAVLVGSCAEYDWKYGHCREFVTPCVPETLYGTSKHALYLLADKLATQYGISLSWARLFFLFGEHEYRQRLIPSMITSLLQNKKFVVKNEYQVRDFIFVEDAATALVELLLSDIVGPINIASGKALSIRELATFIAHSMDATDYIHYEAKEDFNHHIITADVTRLRTELKWRPHYPLNIAIQKTIKWWREYQ